jgi:predicted nucleotidyltransferase component of viral defense system
MITQDAIRQLAIQYHTTEFPNIIREYFQHLFLSHLYKIDETQNLPFKGGTALRFIYGSPRFSEDLDFSIFNVATHEIKNFIENAFAKVLVDIDKIGIKVELGPKPGITQEGYYGDASFKIYDYPPVTVSINVSARNERKMAGEIETIANDFVPAYNLFRLSQDLLIEEKIDALFERQKARDFYDVYFILRKGLLKPEQKHRLSSVQELLEATSVDFESELGTFLPQDQQAIIKDFGTTLLNELNRQLAI